MAIGREPGDVAACLVFDASTLVIDAGSYGVDVASIVADSPTSVRVTLTNPGDADRLSIVASADGDAASATAVVVEPTGAPNEWRISWAAVGGGGGSPSGPTNSLQVNAGAGVFTGYAGATFDGSTFNVDAFKVDILSKNALDLESATAAVNVASYGAGINLTLTGDALRVNGAPGNPGDVLTSNGSGAVPTWSALPSSVTSIGVVSPLTTSGGTTPTLAISPGGPAGDVLTWNGASWAAAAPPSGSIGGTIAANEIAFGTGPNSIGGSGQLEWNAGTAVLTVADPGAVPVFQVNAADALTSSVTITGGTDPIFALVSSVDGTFYTVNPSQFQGTWIDPLAPNYTTTIGPTDVAVADGGQSGNVSAGQVSATENGTAHTVALRVPGGVGTLVSEDASAVPQPLDVVCGELRVNSSPGFAGAYLTSQGAGSAPIWTQPAATFPIDLGHNNATPVYGPAVYLPGGFSASSSALFEVTGAGDVAAFHIANLLGLLVDTWTSSPAVGAGYVTATPAVGLTLAPGWYRFGVSQQAGGGSGVTLLGLNFVP